ncbi:MAG TPA: hypothetical protein PK230_10725, partial [Chitinophagales bacterium]|nr:hypothetical protein [Chitinophagales bacterium]
MNYKQLFFLFIFILVFHNPIAAQTLAHYTDVLGRLWVFDNGNFQQLEHQNFKNIQRGNDYLLYVNALGEMVWYKNGQKNVLQRAAQPQF